VVTTKRRHLAALGLAFLLGCALSRNGNATETVKIGVIKLASSGPSFIALEKGYFAAEGLAVQPVYFETGEPIAVAATAGDIDIGIAGLTAGLYNLGSQLRLIGGYIREVPGFQGWCFVASNKAFEAGLKSYSDLTGRTVGISQIGGLGHYLFAHVADKYHVDLKSVRLTPLQSNSNMLSALVGSQVDLIVTPGTPVTPIIRRGDAKLLGWAADEMNFQIGAIFATAKTANDRRAALDGFLRAFRKGAQDYHDAFIGPDDRPHDGATTPETLAIIAKYVGQTPELIKLTIPYIDPQARLDVKDVLSQIDWYKSQRMVKADIDGSAIIDQRYAVALP
jgi:NitT/TauT family transport system substrate-binding protein